MYINNLDKNLWEVDEMIANLTDSIPEIYMHKETKIQRGVDNLYSVIDTTGYKNYKQIFQDFANQRKTNVQNGGVFAKVLKLFYEKKLKENQKIYYEFQKRINETKLKEEKVFLKLKKEYNKVLKKREKYRMQTYGFILTETGWINVDIGTKPKDWRYVPIRIFVKNRELNSHTYVYVIYQSINSLLRLEEDEAQYYSIQKGSMPTYKDERILIVSISTFADKFYFSHKEVYVNEVNTNKISIKLKEVKESEINLFLGNLKKKGDSNDIKKDMEYLEKFKKHKDLLIKESEYIDRLHRIAFPCFYQKKIGYQN